MLGTWIDLKPIANYKFILLSIQLGPYWLPYEYYYCPHLIDEATEAQRCETVYPRSYCMQVIEVIDLDFEPSSSLPLGLYS